MKYSIFEENMERLEKKLTRVQNKCKKYGASFHYEVVGEEFKDVEFSDGEGETFTKTLRYVIVDVEGFAKINDWEFVATIDHHGERNVIRQIIDIEIPDRYWTSLPVCEHCNTSRHRNDTYLVHNTKTDEFKQVGSGCLRDFTGGYDAELAAAYISMYDYLIEGESYDPSGFGGFINYRNLDTVLKMSAAIVDKMGYTPTSSGSGTPTKFILLDLEDVVEHNGATTKSTRYIVDSGLYNYFKSYDNDQYINDMKKYYIESEDTSSYMQNIKTIFSSDYCKGRDFGYIVSAVHCYNKELAKREAREIAEKRRVSEAELSQYQGEVGKKITFKVNSFKCVSSYEGMYGEISYLFKFIDLDGNVYMWSTSKDINEELGIDSITGTVKKHEEFRGLKQTWVTRCKITFGKIEKPKHESPEVDPVEEAFQLLDMMEEGAC